ncbi:MAG: threonylcarbamoyl-AMP synthase [Saprospiraceae bacterium]|jgi:L-threonylcarbamoyladenylate synthase|nr:threonylcarbamoyl-AMP synthase [Saprospiraceae bacterium]
MIGTDLDKAVALLEAEEVVAIPTETVYGLAGNAFSVKAVSGIFEAKNRPSFDPLIVHVADKNSIKEVVQNIPKELDTLSRHFMPGPLTLLLPKNEKISDLVTAGSPLVAIRIPKHPLAKALLQRLPFPLCAPSANPFGYISPTHAEHVEAQLGEKIAYILDGGACEVGVESTIVGMEEGKLTIFRKGGIPVEALEALIGPVQVKTHSSSNPKAPGMLKSHYAPQKPFVIGDISLLLQKYSQTTSEKEKKVGVLSFKQTYSNISAAYQRTLSPMGDLREAAQNLFAAMRYLDEIDVDVIIAELLPEEGLGRAINDRLKRAAV